MNYGLGNWHDIAENFLKNKSAMECEEHYFGMVYRSGDGMTSDMYSSIKKDNGQIDEALSKNYNE